VTIYAFLHCPARLQVALIQLQRSFAKMDQKLAQLSVLNQKDKGTTYLALLSSIFSSQGNPNIANDVHALVDHLINQDAGIIASRQVLSELINGLTSTNIPNKELRKAVVEDVLSVVQLRATSYEEQVRAI
jgi:COP9 signalosome complex subunit 4